MKQPLQITFRDIPHSDALEAEIRDKAGKLDQFYDRIMACRVIVESPDPVPLAVVAGAKNAVCGDQPIGKPMGGHI